MGTTGREGQAQERVAVIVVSGVGDDALGSGRSAVADTLAADPGRRWQVTDRVGEERLVAAADTGDDPEGGVLRTGVGSPNLREPFRVPTARATGAGGAPDVDVYEMHWADLSRAQGPVQRLFYLLIAITMQVSTIGLEAVRRFPNQSRTTIWTARLLTVISYWLVYVLAPLVLAMAVLALIVNLQLLTDPSGQTQWVLLGVLGAAGIAAGWWIADRTYGGGWTFDRADATPWAYGERPAGDPWPFAVLLTVTVVGVATVIAVAADAGARLMVQIAYLTAVGAVAVLAATRLVRRPPDPALPAEEGRRRTRRRVRLVIRAAYAAIPAGAVLLAVLNEPRDGGAAVRSANALTSIAAGPFRIAWIVLLAMSAACVMLLIRMRRGDGADRDARRQLSATAMLSIMLGPVLFALATSAMFLIFAAIWKLYPESAKTWDPTTEAPYVLCPGDTVATPAVRCDPTVTSTSDWGTDLVRAVIQPLGLGLILTGLTVTLVMWFFMPYLRTFRRRARSASAVDVSVAQGRAFTEGLRRAGTDRMFVWCYTPTVVLSAVAAVVIWCVPSGPVQAVGDFLASVAFPLAYLLAILGIAGVGLSNLSPASRLGGGFIAVLGLVLDVIYDVATYLRIANPAIVAPRIRMLARYRAVLARVGGGGYDRTVVMAHSQGTILSLATLLGDPHRAPAAAPVPAGGVPRNLTFLSYGSPVCQTYARRFPGQFAQWREQAVAMESPIARWLNIYRAGDYIGRGIVPPTVFDPATPDEPPIRERCLGPGHHTGYLGDERWRRVARHVVATSGAVALADVDLDDLTVASLDTGPAARGDDTVELGPTHPVPD